MRPRDVATLRSLLGGGGRARAADESRWADTATNQRRRALSASAVMKSSKLIYRRVIHLASLALRHVNHRGRWTGRAAAAFGVTSATTICERMNSPLRRTTSPAHIYKTVSPLRADSSALS